MKSKIPLCLALVLSGGLLACSTIAGESHVGNTDEYQWGEAVDGFQMATSLDETNGILHCWIRNATTNEMDYPSSHFGYCEFTHLEVQAATNWVSIGLPLGAHTIRGFLPYLVGRIKPGQIITNTSYPQELAAWPVRSSNTLPDIRLVALRDF